LSGLITDIDVSLLSRKNFILCENESVLSTNNLTANALPSTGCELYAKSGDDFLCVKCSHGKSGVVKNFAAEGSPPLYGIFSCVDIPHCVTQITSYEGLGWAPESSFFKTAFETFMSCSACSDNRLPFFQFSESSATTVGKFDFIEDIPVSAEPSGMSVTCIDIYGGTEIGTHISTIPTNCAMGVWHIDREKSTDDKAFVCVACRPGFKATHLTDSGLEYGISSCDPIENCDPLKGGKWYSSCSKCSIGYFWEVTTWTSHSIIDYSVCKASTASSECLIVNSSGECVTCQKQAFKNEDETCEFIYMNSCSNSYLFEWFNSSEYPTMLPSVLAPQGDGCLSCVTGQNAIDKVPANLPCSRSDYVLSNIFPMSTSFILNCLNYGYDEGNNQIICKQCSADYRLNVGETKCITKSISIGCQVFENDETNCRTCEDNYSIFNGKCFLNDIQNCIQYDIESGVVVCKQCQDEYYLNNKKCEKGKVDNCNQYFTNGDPFGCQSCKETYALFYTKLGNALCLAFDKGSQRTYCNVWNTLTNNKEYYCEECKTGYTRTENISLLEYPANICIGNYLIL
jgi:hypothetical protein